MTSEQMSSVVLGVFAKRPVAGQVKTRLAAETSADWAASVAEAFLLDLLDRLAAYPARRVLAYAPASDEAYFEEAARGRFELTPQASGDLGKRMAAFFTGQFSAGADRAVLLGTDSPTLPLELIDAAIARLMDADLVLGPAADGGYYLIGCGREIPPVFAGISWGGPTVLDETVACLSDPRWRLALLPVWNDVDTLADWWSLSGYLAAARRSGADLQLPRIAALQWPGN